LEIPPRSELKTILLPSGDHVGLVFSPSKVSRVWVSPSVSKSQMSLFDDPISMVKKKFQRDGPFQLGVLGFVDHPHAAFTEFFENFVMRYGFADHLPDPSQSSTKFKDFKSTRQGVLNYWENLFFLKYKLLRELSSNLSRE